MRDDEEEERDELKAAFEPDFRPRPQVKDEDLEPGVRVWVTCFKCGAKYPAGGSCPNGCKEN